MDNNKIKSITSQILSLERKHQLYKIRFKKKFLVWPFYRMYFYFNYLNYLNVSEKRKRINDIKLPALFRRLIVLLFNSNLFSILIKQKKKFLIISSQRYFGNEEIYTNDLKKVIENDYIEFSLSEKFLFHKGPIYLDLFKIIFKLISKIGYKLVKTPNSVINFINEINAPANFIGEYKRYSIEYALWFYLFDFILKIQQPKKVFFVSGTYFTPLIAASQKNRIEIFEIQHGVINEYHLAYHFPKLKGEGFYSTGLLLLSDYWKKKANYPIGTKLITIGNSYYACRKQRPKLKKSIVFISQPNISKQLIDYLLLNLSFFLQNDFNLCYKLHPSEYDNWAINYSQLDDLKRLGHISILTNEKPLDLLLAETEIIFGVSSTLIYEGIDSKCKAFILDLASYEYFTDLIDQGVVKKLNHMKKLTLEDFKFNPKPIGRFFSQPNIEQLQSLTSS